MSGSGGPVAGPRVRMGFARRFDGADAEVLVETARAPGGGLLGGYTRNYLRVELGGPDVWRGRRLPVRRRLGPGATLGAVVGGGDA